MYFANGPQFQAVLDTVRDPHDVDLELLRTELKKPQYAGLDVLSVHEILHRNSVIDNPEPRDMVPRTGKLDWNEFLGLLIDGKGDQNSAIIAVMSKYAGEGSASDPSHTAAVVLQAVVNSGEPINFDSSIVADAINTFRDNGLMDKTVADSILTMPNPTWKAKITVDPVAWTLCGQGAIIRVDEVAQVMG